MRYNLMDIAFTYLRDIRTGSYTWVSSFKKKSEWLKNTLENETRNDTIIKTLNTDCENVESLKKLNDINIIRYGKHIKNCALQKYLTNDRNARKICEI